MFGLSPSNMNEEFVSQALDSLSICDLDLWLKDYNTDLKLSLAFRVSNNKTDFKNIWPLALISMYIYVLLHIW